MPPVSKVQRLNAEDKEWLDRELIQRGFSGYDALEDICRERGIDISSSSLHRYGSDFRSRLDSVKMITEQARAVVAEAPDDEGAINEALMRLVQEKLFTLVMDAELDASNMKLSSVAKAIADLGRASVSQKRLAADARKQALEEAAASAENVGRAQGLTPEGVAAMREAIMGAMA